MAEPRESIRLDYLSSYSSLKATEYGTLRRWLASALIYVCALLFPLMLEGGTMHTDEEVTIKVNAEVELGELYNFWSTSVQTTQGDFADRANHQRIREQHPFAKYINCVRFLGGRYGRKDDYFRGVGDDGQARCDFSEGLRNLRGIIECGFTPRIVLDNVPVAMSQPKQLYLYGNTQPPKDFDIWHSYIRQLVEALVSEFGREEVSRWRFRVGTEPDLYPGHWSGTKEEYFKHYDYTVDAVTSVIPEADIGPGNILDPSGNNPRAKYPYERWGLDIIDHIAVGTNYKTDKVGTRMRFFAYSWYGHVGLPIDSFDTAVEKVRERLSKYPQFADVPIEVHEFAVLTDDKGGRLYAGDASEWAASWMAAIADRVYRLGVAQVYQWTTTKYGIPNPRTHVLAILERMAGGRRLAVEGPSAGKLGKIGCLASVKDDGIDLLIYRHKPERDDGRPVKARVVLAGDRVANEGWRIVRGYRIDRNHSGYIRAFYKDAEARGLEPLPDASLFGGIYRRFGPKGLALFKANREKYRKLGRLRELSPLPALSRDESGGFSLPVVLAGHSVIYLRLEQ